MKDEVQISPNYVIAWMVLLFIGSVIAFIYFGSNYLRHKKEINNLVTIELNGQINILQNRNRGSYDLKIGDYDIHSLPIA